MNAFPNRVLRGRISNIGQIMDPNLRTAKVRLEVENPGLMRFGMFVTATFHGMTKEKHASVPATAILHLHDREWVYVPAGTDVPARRSYRREYASGKCAGSDCGIKPGSTRLVANALVMQNTVEQ